MRALIAERSKMTTCLRGEIIEIPYHCIGFLLEGFIKTHGLQEELITPPAALIPSQGNLSFRTAETSGNLRPPLETFYVNYTHKSMYAWMWTCKHVRMCICISDKLLFMITFNRLWFLKGVLCLCKSAWPFYIANTAMAFPFLRFQNQSNLKESVSSDICSMFYSIEWKSRRVISWELPNSNRFCKSILI